MAWTDDWQNKRTATYTWGCCFWLRTVLVNADCAMSTWQQCHSCQPSPCIVPPSRHGNISTILWIHRAVIPSCHNAPGAVYVDCPYAFLSASTVPMSHFAEGMLRLPGNKVQMRSLHWQNIFHVRARIGHQRTRHHLQFQHRADIYRPNQRH